MSCTKLHKRSSKASATRVVAHDAPALPCLAEGRPRPATCKSSHPLPADHDDAHNGSRRGTVRDKALATSAVRSVCHQTALRLTTTRSCLLSAPCVAIGTPRSPAPHSCVGGHASWGASPVHVRALPRPILRTQHVPVEHFQQTRRACAS